MSQSNDNEQGSDQITLNKECSGLENNDVQVLSICLSIDIDVQKICDRSKIMEYAKISNAIVDRFMGIISNVSFPPGKFETPYNFPLDFKDITSNKDVDVKISLLWSKGFEAKGLVCRYEDDLLSISGTPDNPQGFDGDVQFILNGNFYDVKELWKNRGFSIKSCFEEVKIHRKFVLNPDPESLWEDKPTLKDEPFQKENQDRQSFATNTEPALTILGASQRGRSHAQIGSFRDDHFLIRLGENPDDWNFVAVADGAGSARFSREGSKIACEAWIDDPKGGIATLFKSHQERLEQEVNSLLCRISSSSEVDFSRELSQTNLQKLFYYSVCYAWYAINNVSTNVHARINDFNTTLLCAAFKRLPKTEQTPPRWIVLSYWVGDGGLAIYRPDGKDEVLALGTPDGGEFAGQTRFLTMKSELEEKSICGRLRLAVVKDFQALVLATDGITDPFFPAEANLSDYAYWQKFWNETLPKEFPGVLDTTKTLEERGKALLDGLMFKSKGNHDDRTLVLVLNDHFQKSQEVVSETSDFEEKIVPDAVDETAGVSEAQVETPTSETRSLEEISTDEQKTDAKNSCRIMEDFESKSDDDTVENHSDGENDAVLEISPAPMGETAGFFETQSEMQTIESHSSVKISTDAQKTEAENSCRIIEDSEPKNDVDTVENHSVEENAVVLEIAPGVIGETAGFSGTQGKTPTIEDRSSEEFSTDSQKTGAEISDRIMENFEAKNDVDTVENHSVEENAVVLEIASGAIGETAGFFKTQSETPTIEARSAEEISTDAQKTEAENFGRIIEDSEPKNDVDSIENFTSEGKESNVEKTENETSDSTIEDLESKNAVDPLASENGEIPVSNAGINSECNESVADLKNDDNSTVEPASENVARSETISEIQNVETEVSGKSPEGSIRPPYEFVGSN